MPRAYTVFFQVFMPRAYIVFFQILVRGVVGAVAARMPPLPIITCFRTQRLICAPLPLLLCLSAGVCVPDYHGARGAVVRAAHSAGRSADPRGRGVDQQRRIRAEIAGHPARVRGGRGGRPGRRDSGPHGQGEGRRTGGAGRARVRRGVKSRRDDHRLLCGVMVEAVSVLRGHT